MTSTGQRRPSYLKILANRSFFAFWFGQLVSVSGDAVFDVALLWLVLTTTGSVLLVGITQAVILLPSVIVAPIFGVYIDRFNRRDIILVANVLEGFIVGIISVLYIFHLLSFLALIVLVFLLYSGAEVVNAAGTAIIPRIVEDKSNLAAANSLFSLTTSFNQFASYAFGGVIIAVIGVVLPIVYDSFSFFFAAAMLLFVAKYYGAIASNNAATDSSPSPSSAVPVDPITASDKKEKIIDWEDRAGEKRSFGADFRKGLKYLTSSKVIVELTILGAIVNFFVSGIGALLAPYAKLWLNGNASTYGFLLASFSIGLFLGAYLAGKIENLRQYAGRLSLSCVIAVGVTLALMGVVSIQFVSFALFFVFGFLVALANIPIRALLQVKIPQEVFGRVYSVFIALNTVVTPLSAALSGGVASYISIGTVFILYGLLIVVVTAVAYFVFKELRLARY